MHVIGKTLEMPVLMREQTPGVALDATSGSHTGNVTHTPAPSVGPVIEKSSFSSQGKAEIKKKID